VSRLDARRAANLIERRARHIFSIAPASRIITTASRGIRAGAQPRARTQHNRERHSEHHDPRRPVISDAQNRASRRHYEIKIARPNLALLSTILKWFFICILWWILYRPIFWRCVAFSDWPI